MGRTFCVLAAMGVATAAARAGEDRVQPVLIRVGQAVQGVPGAVISDISSVCAVNSTCAFFVADLSGPGITAGQTSAHILYRPWGISRTEDPVVLAPLYTGTGFTLPGLNATLVKNIILTESEELIVHAAHRQLPGDTPADVIIRAAGSWAFPQVTLVSRKGDGHMGSPAGVGYLDFYDLAYSGGDRLVLVGSVAGPGINTTNDVAVFGGIVSNNQYFYMREGIQAPASPFGSIINSLVGSGQVSVDLGGHALIPATVQLAGPEFALLRAAYFVQQLSGFTTRRLLTAGDAAAPAFAYMAATPGVLTHSGDARCFEDNNPNTLRFSALVRSALMYPSFTTRATHITGDLVKATGVATYTRLVTDGDAILNTPSFTYTGAVGPLMANSFGLEAGVFDGTTSAGLSMSDLVLATSFSPFTARLRENDPAPGFTSFPALFVDTMEVAGLSTDGAVLVHAGFRVGGGTPTGSGAYMLTPPPEQQLVLLARTGETMTVAGQPRSVTAISTPRFGAGSNGEDGRKRSIVPQGVALVLTLDNGTRAMKVWENVPACPADVGVQGGVAGSDGLLNNNDFIVFIGWFFAQTPSADVGSQGGVPGADGLFNNNDFIIYINQFFTGCG